MFEKCSPLFDGDRVTSILVVDGGKVEGAGDVSVGDSEAEPLAERKKAFGNSVRR